MSYIFIYIYIGVFAFLFVIFTWRARSTTDSFDVSFLSRCASSTTRKHQRCFFSADTSAETIS